MACFVAPAAVAVATTVARKAVQKKEGAAATEGTDTQSPNIAGKWTQRLGWLNTMLWGGAVLLALEHVWHGEVVPWPPFFTAMESPDQIVPMLKEIAIYGGAMTAAILVVWTGMVLVAEHGPKLLRLRGSDPKAADRGA